MLKYFIWGLIVSSVVALKESDLCPNENEKPGILEKFCEKEKYDIKKELTCVCDWIYFRNKDGECVSPFECDGKTTTTATTTTTTTTTPKPPTTPCEPQKPNSKCPEGYELYIVPCNRHYGGHGYGGYGGKKCAVCKKPKYGKYPYGK